MTLHRAQMLLDTEQHAALERMARGSNRSMSDLVRHIVGNYLVQASEEESLQRSLAALDGLTALRRQIEARSGRLPAGFLEEIRALRIRPITPAASLHARALAWAARLRHFKAYDAQYVALAEEMRCGLLTSDLRLAAAARALGASWVSGVQSRA